MTHRLAQAGMFPTPHIPWLRPVGQTGLTVSAICARGQPSREHAREFRSPRSAGSSCPTR